LALGANLKLIVETAELVKESGQEQNQRTFEASKPQD